MPVEPITQSQHGKRRWRRPQNFSFAARNAFVVLGAEELPKAVAMLVPFAFARVAGDMAAVAVLGLRPGENVLVAPDGRWVGHYIPAAVRCYPFSVARSADGREVLCFNEDSGLVSQDKNDEPFFDEEGKPSPSVQQALTFAQQVRMSLKACGQFARALDAAGVLSPWVLDRPANRPKVEVTCVNEALLNALPDDKFIELKASGALAAAYCQLLSMQHFAIIKEIAAARQAGRTALSALPVTPQGELDLEFLNRPNP